MQYISISFNFTKIHKMCELWLFRIVRICFAILAFAVRTIKSEIITDPYLSNPLHNTCCLLYRIVVLPTGKSIPSIEIGILCFVETHGP